LGNQEKIEHGGSPNRVKQQRHQGQCSGAVLALLSGGCL
jgi:hypothetical protein